MSEGAIEKLSTDEIQKLIQQASPHEMKFLLILDDYRYHDSYFSRTEFFEVVFGEIDKLELFSNCRNGEALTRYLIIPKAVPTVINHVETWDLGTDVGEKHRVYVFTKEGWLLVEAV